MLAGGGSCPGLRRQPLLPWEAPRPPGGPSSPAAPPPPGSPSTPGGPAPRGGPSSSRQPLLPAPLLRLWLVSDQLPWLASVSLPVGAHELWVLNCEGGPHSACLEKPPLSPAPPGACVLGGGQACSPWCPHWGRPAPVSCPGVLAASWDWGDHGSGRLMSPAPWSRASWRRAQCAPGPCVACVAPHSSRLHLLPQGPPARRGWRPP